MSYKRNTQTLANASPQDESFVALMTYATFTVNVWNVIGVALWLKQIKLKREHNALLGGEEVLIQSFWIGFLSRYVYF